MVEIPSDNPIEPEGAGKESGDGKNNTLPEEPQIPSKSNIQPPIKNKCHSERSLKEVREWGKAFIEAATFLAVLWYACVASHQLTEMHNATVEATRSADTAEKTMVLDERAWVGVPAVNGTKPEVGKRLTFSVHFTNTGKSPARNVVIYPADEILRKDQSPNFANEPKQMRLGVLSPGSERTYSNNVPMANGKFEFTQPAADYLKTQVLSVHGKITYDDIFGCHHWVTYAAYLNEDWSGYSFYSEHNDTDNNYQPCQN